MSIEVELFELADGTSPVIDFLESLDNKLRAKMFREIDLLCSNGQLLRMPHSRSVGDGLFELRAIQGNNICRVLFFFHHGGKAVLTNGFIKKTDKTPHNEIEIAKRYMREYIERQHVEKG